MAGVHLSEKDVTAYSRATDFACLVRSDRSTGRIRIDSQASLPAAATSSGRKTCPQVHLNCSMSLRQKRIFAPQRGHSTCFLTRMSCCLGII